MDMDIWIQKHEIVAYNYDIKNHSIKHFQQAPTCYKCEGELVSCVFRSAVYSWSGTVTLGGRSHSRAVQLKREWFPIIRPVGILGGEFHKLLIVVGQVFLQRRARGVVKVWVVVIDVRHCDGQSGCSCVLGIT